MIIVYLPGREVWYFNMHKKTKFASYFIDNIKFCETLYNMYTTVDDVADEIFKIDDC